MKDKQLKLEEIESFYTLGGVGEGRVQGRGKWRGCRFFSNSGLGSTNRDDIKRLFYCYRNKNGREPRENISL